MKGIGGFVLFGLLVIGAAMLSGCVGHHYSRTDMSTLNSGTETLYTSSNYTVLGPVSAEGTSSCILGYESGKQGYGLLWEVARKKYGDKVTGIKDVAAATEYFAILAPAYYKVKTVYSGTAVQQK